MESQPQSPIEGINLPPLAPHLPEYGMQKRPTHPLGTDDVIRIRGARAHNLCNLDVDLPRNHLIVITGVSGSGKSSLAFDTLYAEGQRQYIESLSVYARQFLGQLPRPDVDLVDGLEPTLCIDQKLGTNNPRSTVATTTEVYDYLRLLFARLGTPHCYRCGTAIVQQSAETIIEMLLKLPAGTKLMLLAPLIRGRRGAHAELFEEIRKAGLLRARVDGEIYELEHIPEIDARKNHTIEAVVDRIVVREGIDDRLAESVRLALRFGEGLVSSLTQQSGQATWHNRLFSTQYACPDCGVSYEELEPRTFSFNSPYGACQQCDGMGRLEPSPQSKKRKEEHALSRREQPCPACAGGRLRPEALHVRVADTTIHQLTSRTVDEAIEWFTSLKWAASENEIARPICSEVLKRLRFLQTVGVHYLALERPADTLSGGELQRVRLATSIGSGLVGVCYVLDEPSIGLHQRDNDRLIQALRDLQQLGNTVLVVEHDESMMRAADWLIDMGPGAGHRGGRIISQGTPEEVADDPESVTGRYLAAGVQRSLFSQRSSGDGRQNIPHLAVAESAADDVADGEPPVSLYRIDRADKRESERRAADRPRIRRKPDDRWIVLKGASTHNLQHVTARIPVGCLVGVTGVSGSGKSSLINDTLYPALARQLGLIAPCPGDYEQLIGDEFIDKLIRIDQTPIGRSPRSCPATYSGAMDEIRKVYATTRDAKQKGFTAARFSFNAAAGRCTQCKGQGLEKIEMNFLSDLYIRCSRCRGKRFNRQTLTVRFKGATIADVMEMTIDQATEFFENHSKVKRILDALADVGLGYLQLGQSSTTLSGGEAQRMKLGTELARTQTGATLYLLDEPTTGLHFEDVQRLLNVLQQLVDQGNTVIVIEHNLDVGRACDWLIDLGPEGGSGGGQILAAGPPEAIAAVEASATGRFL
ncbi:MAG: ABC-ATPase UvrA [Pirellulaceae bacterium]